MLDHLASDREWLEYWIERLKKNVIKEFRKRALFPMCKTEELTSRANNKYIIFFYVDKPEFIDLPLVSIFCTHYVNGKMRVAHLHELLQPDLLNNGQKSPVRSIDIYTNHFFERYNERFLKDKSLKDNEIVHSFLLRNIVETLGLTSPIHINEDINKNLAKYGENADYGLLVRDGFCFAKNSIENRGDGSCEAFGFTYTTFLSKSDLKEVQIEAINKENYQFKKNLLKKI